MKNTTLEAREPSVEKTHKRSARVRNNAWRHSEETSMHPSQSTSGLLNRPVTKAFSALLALFFLTPLVSVAQSESSSAELDASIKVEENVREHLGNFEITSVSESLIPGLYELVSGGTILYVNQGGNLLIEGDMIDLENRTNLTEQRKGKLHMGMISQLSESDVLVYEPEEPTGRSITVFTDISCGYCQRLHQELDTYLDAGVAVRYLMFPRAGLQTPAANALESVWCNEDPQAAMTTAKSGGRVPPKSCDNPMEQHVALAQQVGLRGTPLIYLDTGDRIPGYRDAATVVDMVLSNEKWAP